ncbi:hypothetical protein INS49_008995 [Diaporthe citri]|uniref:uncharacterized protein n=1 Tax=Diaporthe citri TaxID=83186 RepID=UPI001C811250|nr:uncharacterized protein INS49_008995 [Diaporthe citri]KAG6363892.1 hypothetical protein INS49_008995 [Diaporthe citri]
MASLLRQIVAGPRAKHAETGLDLCYVTDDIIVTSGPSQTYPQRAYRNPLDRLVAFLDAKHPDNWAIWEFRAEGTGYPDEAVYGRIRHYPWPDHHPPPFRMVPMIMASMRSWLHEEDTHSSDTKKDAKGDKGKEVGKKCGWKAEDALARFTERRMRPTFGAGVSIPSQLRWISYADRWTKGGKKYIDREVEVLEIHVWGLRHGVKVNVEGFADEGKKIKVLHTFKKEERYVVQGDAPGGGGVMDLLGDAWSPTNEDDEIYEDADYNEIVGNDSDKKGSDSSNNASKDSSPARSKSKKGSRASRLVSGSPARNSSVNKASKSKTINPADFAGASETSSPSASSLIVPNKNTSQPSLAQASTFADTNEPGGMAVIFKPTSPIRISNSDVNVSLERRNRAPSSLGLTMVTAVAHVWFNVFFEGGGPEQNGRADESGVFAIDWDKMDGIKGSSRKGTRAADRISVVWRVVGTNGPVPEVKEPGEGSPVPEMRPADWKGEHDEDPGADRKLGLRAETSASASVSKASSVKSAAGDGGKEGGDSAKESDDESLTGVKSSDPTGQELKDSDSAKLAVSQGTPQEGSKGQATGDELSDHEKKVEATRGRTANPEKEASGATKSEEQLLEAAMAPVREARLSKASETAIVQKKAEEEAASSTNPSEEHGGQGSDDGKDHDSGERKLGFVRAGKKLLPLHSKKTDEDGKDPRVVNASVKK